VKADVVIIGGGLMGSCTALHLAMRGRRVIVVEKDSPGRHASGVNAGGLRQLNRHPAEIPLSVAAAEIWRNLRSLVDSDCDVKLAGQVRVAENPQDLERLEQRAALVRSLGYQHEQIIGRDDWIKKVLSRLGEDVYITIDLDALDPGIMPSTGTPANGDETPQ